MFTMGLTNFEQIAIWAVFAVAWLGLAYAVFLRSQILREDKGTEKMQEVWGAIKDGANAYLQKQFRSILPLIAILTVVLFLSVYVVPPSAEALQEFPNNTKIIIINTKRTLTSLKLLTILDLIIVEKSVLRESSLCYL